MEQQPLPDFTQAGLRFAEASSEMQQQFQRMNNVPSVQLQQIANQLTQILHRMDRLDHRMDRLDAKFEHHNNNNMARLQNHYATSPNDPIVHLINPTTGLDIPNFPADSSTITRLNATQIQSILQELGQRVANNQGGGVALLKRQLRIQIGLRADQVQGA